MLLDKWLMLVLLVSALANDAIPFDDETEEAKRLLATYSMLIGKAGKDTTDYSRLTGILSMPEGRAMYYYTKHTPTGYLTEFRTTYRISLKVLYYLHFQIDPCRDKDDFCSTKTSEAPCADHDEIVGGTDLPVAWFFNGYTVACDSDFASKITCGTFLEIHRPGNSIILSSVPITDDTTEGFAMTFIPARDICAGRYEVWFVISTRAGSFILYVKPFYATEPSCTSQQILSSNH